MVGTLTNRMAQLEKRIAGRKRSGRIFRTIGGPAEDNGADLFASLGIVLADADTVIRRTLWQPGDTGPVCVGGPVRMTGAAQ